MVGKGLLFGLYGGLEEGGKGLQGVQLPSGVLGRDGSHRSLAYQVIFETIHFLPLCT